MISSNVLTHKRCPHFTQQLLCDESAQMSPKIGYINRKLSFFSSIPSLEFKLFLKIKIVWEEKYPIEFLLFCRLA